MTPEPAGTLAGPKIAVSTATKVPHAVLPNHSPELSPAWRTSQLRSGLVVILVSGPGDTMLPPGGDSMSTSTVAGAEVAVPSFTVNVNEAMVPAPPLGV